MTNRNCLFLFRSLEAWPTVILKKKIENLKEVSKKRQRNSFNLVKRKQVNEAIKVACRWRLSKHPDLVGILPILFDFLFDFDLFWNFQIKKWHRTGVYLSESDI